MCRDCDCAIAVDKVQNVRDSLAAKHKQADVWNALRLQKKPLLDVFVETAYQIVSKELPSKT